MVDSCLVRGKKGWVAGGRGGKAEFNCNAPISVQYEKQVTLPEMIKKLLLNYARRYLLCTCEFVLAYLTDSICSCGFAKELVRWGMLDKFHAPQHIREVCRTVHNPFTSYNAKTRKRLGCTVTVAAEHVFRFCNRHVSALKIGRYMVSRWGVIG